MSAYEHANENAKFKRSESMYNNKENKELRAKWKNEKKTAEAKKKVEDAAYKSEGQVNVKF
ncbi:MAG: hypothetical protein WCX16_01440, partial [Candidatus Omnitrophota bacterium]